MLLCFVYVYIDILFAVAISCGLWLVCGLELFVFVAGVCRFVFVGGGVGFLCNKRPGVFRVCACEKRKNGVRVAMDG